MLVDAAGVPLSLVATGANRHDGSKLETRLHSVVIERPDIFVYPQQLCLDKGYAGESAWEAVVMRGFVPHNKRPWRGKTVASGEEGPAVGG
jgi:hypothetical protein